MRSELSSFLDEQFRRDGIRIAILGVGNDLNGDDAAGVVVARRIIAWLKKRSEQAPGGSVSHLHALEHGRLLVFDSGPSPESFTGPLRRFQPDLIILVDAAELGASPGAVHVFDWKAAEGMSASTHGMPPTLLAKFLVAELQCEVALVGIQPAQLTLDSPISPEVRLAVRRVTRNFRNRIARHF